MLTILNPCKPRQWRSIRNSLLMLFFMLIMMPALATTREGRLHKVTGDSPVEQGSEERYYLVDDQGNWHQLQIDPVILKKLGPAHQWQGKQFEVETQQAGSSGDEDAALPIVIDIRPATQDTERTKIMRESNVLSGPTGSLPWINILLRFADDPEPTPPNPSDFYSALMSNSYPGLDHYWSEVSYDVINISGSRVVGWYTLPQNRDYYLNDSGDPDFGRTVNDAAAVADADVYFPDFEGINLFFADSFTRGWGGSSSIDRDDTDKSYATTWLPAWTHSYHAYVAHEMGHGFGLPHSSGPYDTAYDSRWDPMSDSFGFCGGDNAAHPDYGCISVHTNGYHKDLLDWIPPENILTFEPSDNLDVLVDLERLANADFGSGRAAMLKLLLPDDDFYIVEARLRSGYDANIPGEAVIIHEVSPGRDRPAQVVDTTDDDDPNDEGAQWIAGETAVLDGGWRVSVEAQNDTAFHVRVSRAQTPPEPPQPDGLNLEAWDPGQTPTETKLATRITNHTDTPVALNRLSVKAWFNDQAYSQWIASGYGYNQSVFTVSGGWVSNVASAPSLAIEAMPELMNCGNGRTANREVTIEYGDLDELHIPPNGGYVTTNVDGAASFATWHRADWSTVNRSADYSRVSESGNSSAARANLSHMALYLDGQLVTESVSASEPDSSTGREPCS